MRDVQKWTEKKKPSLALNLSRNEIGDIGARAIGEAIANDDRLKRLSMCGNKSIEEQGTRAIASGL